MILYFSLRDFRQILPVERNPMDSINTCLKQSFLWQEKIIQPMSLTINERVRQFGGHDSYGNYMKYFICRILYVSYFSHVCWIGIIENEEEKIDVQVQGVHG